MRGLLYNKKEIIDMKRHSFEEIVLLDQALFTLATYDITGGLVAIVKNEEETHALWGKIVKRFNYFKQLIQRGSCTFDFIRNNVLDKNGPFFQAKPKNIEELLDDPDFCKEDDDELMEKSNDLLRTIFLSQCFPKNNENQY